MGGVRETLDSRNWSIKCLLISVLHYDLKWKGNRNRNNNRK